MPRIYRPLPPVGGRCRQGSAASTPRTRLELSVRDSDPAQELVSAAGVFYPAGTHRSPQCKDSQRTPGPGTYRLPSTFPLSPRDEAPARHAGYRRAPAWRLNSRNNVRVADVANPYNVIPPAVSLVQQHAEGQQAFDRTSMNRVSINTMPPTTASGEILKGHGGHVPRGHGLPF